MMNIIKNLIILYTSIFFQSQILQATTSSSDSMELSDVGDRYSNNFSTEKHNSADITLTNDLEKDQVLNQGKIPIEGTNNPADNMSFNLSNSMRSLEEGNNVHNTHIQQTNSLTWRDWYYNNAHSFWIVGKGVFRAGAIVTKIIAPLIYVAAYMSPNQTEIVIANYAIGFGSALFSSFADFGDKNILDLEQKESGRLVSQYFKLSDDDKKLFADTRNSHLGKYFSLIFNTWDLAPGVLNFLHIFLSWGAPVLSACGDIVTAKKEIFQLAAIICGVSTFVDESVLQYVPTAKANIIKNLQLIKDYPNKF